MIWICINSSNTFRKLVVIKSILLTTGMLILCHCTKSDIGDIQKSTHAKLIFHSGFELNTAIVIKNVKDFDFVGEDFSVSAPNSWNLFEIEPGNNVYASINCGSQNVNDTTRGVEIVSDPVNLSNKVCRFWGKYPNEGDGLKFRIQADLSSKAGIDTLFYTIRMYLPGDFNVLKRINSTFTWFTIMEFWNKSDPKENMFRMTVDLKKMNKGLDSLRFGLRTEKYNTSLSKFDGLKNYTGNSTVPLNKWMTIEINIVTGDEQTGKFYMSVTPEGETKKVIFNYTLRTCHPDIPLSGMNYFSPFKFYTHGYLIDTLRKAGKSGQVYWDDFELWIDSIAYLIN
jgi:hypothetical protein